MVFYFGRDHRGSMIIPLALSAGMLIAGGGVAVDYTRLSSARADLHRVADAAALTGGRVFVESFGATDAVREAAAMRAADVYAAEYAADAARVVEARIGEREVVVTLTAERPLVFGAFFGTTSSTVAVTSTATFPEIKPACIIALDPSAPAGFEARSSSETRAERCSIWSNATGTGSTAYTGASSTRVRRSCAVGGNSGSGLVHPRPEIRCDPIDDPFAGRVTATGSACTTIGRMESGQSTTLRPGAYCGLDIRGDVRLDPGAYVISGGDFTVAGNARITGVGVTIILEGAARIDWSGTPGITLSAPTTGPYAGLAIAARAGGPPVESRITGNAALALVTDVQGSIYLPNHAFQMTGNADLTLTGDEAKLVARSIEVSGSSRLAVRADDRIEALRALAGLRLSK